MSSAGPRRTLAGRYRLEEVIGRGGMSTVYRATDLSLDRVVAVKVAMDPLLERDPVYAARFKREARAAAALSHPGVVTVFDAGADGPTRYIVMEYVAGRSLSEILREEKPLEPARAAHIAAQIADALAAAHAAGIIHRDIKPGNVMVVGEDRVKVLDFGIARTPDAVTLTQTASVLGTAPYMAPEQAMGNQADARSDIYSLGCVLYEMLTGQPPFMADVAAAVLHQHVRVAPKRPGELNPAIPPALDALVLEMLAKDPRDRPQTAGEVRDRLVAYESHTETTVALPAATAATEARAAATAATEALAAAAVSAAEVPQIATVAQAPTVAHAPTVAPVVPNRPLPPPRRRSGGPWALLAVIALLLLGAAVAYALATGGNSDHAASSPSSSSAAATSSHSPASSTAQHSSSAPASASTPASSSSSSSSTTTTTTTVTATASTPTPPAPPGQDGTPPGHAKKDKKK